MSDKIFVIPLIACAILDIFLISCYIIARIKIHFLQKHYEEEMDVWRNEVKECLIKLKDNKY